MQGRLFTLLDQGFPSYFVLLLLGFTFATVSGAITAKRIGQDPDVFVDLGLAMLIAGVAGARILHVFADGYFWDYVHLCTDPARVDWPLDRAECLSATYDGVWDAAKSVCHPKTADCFAWAKFYNGGLTYYGGFIAASIAAFYLLRADRFPFWKAADMAGMVVPVGLGFGRLGCLLAGCCFGKPWDSSFGVHFPPNSPASEAQHLAKLLPSARTESLLVHPTQLYESAASFGIAAFFYWLHRRKRFDGQIIGTYAVLYGLTRFTIEFFRDDPRGDILGLTTLTHLSTSQLISLFVVAGGIVFLLLRHRRVRGVAASA